ncbi:MAG TPA: hypothetical protein VL992_11000 [Tepidisphaeraceae bacterium]|nr:hypothetical protein [Tepidisphaeraceae bacterium]
MNQLCVLAASLCLAVGCETAHNWQHPIIMGNPETVLITYHVKPGDEAALRQLLKKTWNDYRDEESLVDPFPHVIVCGAEDGGKTKFVEIFTWVSISSPQLASEITGINDDWASMHSLCEARGHSSDIELEPVQKVEPPPAEVTADAH